MMVTGTCGGGSGFRICLFVSQEFYDRKWVLVLVRGWYCYLLWWFWLSNLFVCFSGILRRVGTIIHSIILYVMGKENE